MIKYESFKTSAWKSYSEQLVSKFKYPEELVNNANDLISIFNTLWGIKSPVYSTASSGGLYMGWDFGIFTLVVIIYPQSQVYWQCYSLEKESSNEGYCDITDFPSPEFLDWLEKEVESLGGKELGKDGSISKPTKNSGS